MKEFQIWSSKQMAQSHIKGLAIIRLFIYAGIYTNLFLLVLGGSIDSAVYIPVSMLPPSTSRNELVYIPA